MKGDAGIFEFVLMAVVAVSIIAFIYPWVSGMIKESLDMGEVSALEPQFKDCNLKILETARTGTKNKCIFSISQGELKGTDRGIEYGLVTESPVCERHSLMSIDDESHIWQACNVSSNLRSFKMIWMFPETVTVEATGLMGTQMKGESPVGDIDFGGNVMFITLDLKVEFDYGDGGIGDTIELERKSITSDNVQLSVTVY